MSSMREKKSNISVFIKILMSHIQVIVLTASFDFDWPAEVMSHYFLDQGSLLNSSPCRQRIRPHYLNWLLFKWAK